MKKKMLSRSYHFVVSFIFFLSLFVAQVSSIYADASIGNSIKIAVVQIMFIEHDLVPDASSGNGKFERNSSDFIVIVVVVVFVFIFIFIGSMRLLLQRKCS